ANYVGVHGEFEHDALTAAATAAHNAGRCPAVSEIADGATEHAARQGDDHGFEEEGYEHLPAAEADDAQDGNVIDALTDGGEHRVHDTEHAADGHDDGHDHDTE